MNIYVDSMATLMFAIWHESRQQETSADGGAACSGDKLMDIINYDKNIDGTALIIGATSADIHVTTIFNGNPITIELNGWLVLIIITTHGAVDDTTIGFNKTNSITAEFVNNNNNIHTHIHYYYIYGICFILIVLLRIWFTNQVPEMGPA